MVTQFSEAECALGACDPSGWHNLMHNPVGICKTMKTFYISQGKLDSVKWMSANCEGGWTEEMGEVAMTDAASNGHLETVQYLHEHLNVPATNAAIVAAAENGHLGLVRYLHEISSDPCPTDSIRCSETCACVDSPESEQARLSSVSMRTRELPRLTVETSASYSESTSLPSGEDQVDECPICCDGLDDPFTTACRHTFCTVCILQWLATNNACPACRQTIDILSPAEANGRQISEAVAFQPSRLEEEVDAAVQSSPFYVRSPIGSTSLHFRDDTESPRHLSLSELEDEIARVSAVHRTVTLLTSNRGNARALGESVSYPWTRSTTFSYGDIDREQVGSERYHWPAEERVDHGRYRLPSFDDGDYIDAQEFEPNRWPSPAPLEERQFRFDEANRSRLDSRSHDEEVAETCSICYEVPESRAWTLCHHCFCLSCLDKWREIQDTCPVCRDALV